MTTTFMHSFLSVEVLEAFGEKTKQKYKVVKWLSHNVSCFRRWIVFDALEINILIPAQYSW